MVSGFVLGFVAALAATLSVSRWIEVAGSTETPSSRSVSGMLVATFLIPAAVLWAIRGDVVSGANTVLGMGGIVLGVGVGSGRDAYRGTGAIAVGIAAGAFGANGIGEASAAGTSAWVWAVGLLVFGLGVVIFGVGVVRDLENVRHVSNVIFGVGVIGMGVGVASQAVAGDALAAALITIGIGVGIFGVGLVAVSIGVLTGADREPGFAVIAAGVGGIVAGVGGIMMGLHQIDVGNDIVGAGSLLAGAGAVVLGLGGIVFGFGGIIDNDALERIGNRVFAVGGFALGAGLIAAGTGRAVAEIEGLSAATVLVLSILAAAAGAIALGGGELLIARRDLDASAESFQLRPDTFRRRGIRIQGP